MKQHTKLGRMHQTRRKQRLFPTRTRKAVCPSQNPMLNGNKHSYLLQHLTLPLALRALRLLHHRHRLGTTLSAHHSCRSVLNPWPVLAIRIDAISRNSAAQIHVHHIVCLLFLTCQMQKEQLQVMRFCFLATIPCDRYPIPSRRKRIRAIRTSVLCVFLANAIKLGHARQRRVTTC